MPRPYFLLITSAFLSASIAGCTGLNPAKEAASREVRDDSHAVQTPVYVLPNCQTRAGVRLCQWIEPRGFQPDEGNLGDNAEPSGIAL